MDFLLSAILLPVYTSNTFTSVRILPPSLVMVLMMSSALIALSTIKAISFLILGYLFGSIYLIALTFLLYNLDKDNSIT